jgi:hypothetical protein
MHLELSPETEKRLVAEAARLGVSVELLLKRLLGDLEVRIPAGTSGPRPEVPSFHLGSVGSLRRCEMYGDGD